MGLARNLSKFKPSSDGLVGAEDIATGAVTAEKIAEGAIPAGAGTNTFTASGSITAGRGVAVNADGTVSALSGTLFTPTAVQTVTAYSAANFNSSGIESIGSAFASDGTFILSMNASSYRTTRISTNSNVSASHGVTNLINRGLFYDPTTNKFLNIYYSDSSFNTLYARYLTIDSTTGAVTVVATHSIVSFTNSFGWLNGVGSGWDLNNTGQLVIGMGLYDTSKYGIFYTAFDFTANTFATVTVSTSGTTSEMVAVNWYAPQDKWIISYVQSGTYYNNVYTLSGTSFTLVQTNTGQITDIQTKNPNDLSTAGYVTALSAKLLGITSGTTAKYLTLSSNVPSVTSSTFPYPLGSNSVSARVLESKTIITLGIPSASATGASLPYSEFIVQGGTIYATAISNTQLGSFTVQGDQYNGLSLSGTTRWIYFRQGTAAPSTLNYYTAFATTSEAPSNIGISTQSVTNGQSVTVTTTGGINEDVSGLVTGLSVFMNGDGTLSTDPTSVYVGEALSTTSLLVK
jgi:hypothetical protein